MTKKAYEHIAQAVEAHAETLPDEAPAPENAQDVRQIGGGSITRRVEHTKVTVDGLTLRFPASKPAALAVAAKYRKAKLPPRSNPPLKMPSLKTAPFSQTTLDTFIADGELENAEQYAEMHRREVYYIATDKAEPIALRKAEQLKGDPRFVVGVKPSAGRWAARRDCWTVTHIASGLSATLQRHTSKQSALDEFRAHDPEKLEAALAKAEPLDD